MELKLLHFSSGGTRYAVDVSCVKEVVRMATITPVEEWPPFVLGMLNIRGEMIPILDFLMRARAGTTKQSLSSRILILGIRHLRVGLLVESVREAKTIDIDDISRNVQPDVLIDPKYILGTFQDEKDIVLYIDIEKLLTSKEFHELERLHAR